MGRISSKSPSNPEADFRSRPIVNYYNDMIYRWVVSKLQIEPSDTEKEQEKKREWQRRLSEYKEKYKSDPLTSEKYTSILRITYNSLPDFLHIADLTYGDMFNMFYEKSAQGINKNSESIPFGYPDEKVEKFAKSCEKLPLNKRMVLEEFIQELSSPSIRELTDWQGKLTVRVLNGCGLKVKKKASAIRTDLKREEERPTITSSNVGYFESIKIADLPILAKDYGLSLHWLLQLDSSVHMYSKIQCVDEILDYFCFFDEERQDLFQRIVDDLVERGA